MWEELGYGRWLTKPIMQSAQSYTAVATDTLLQSSSINQDQLTAGTATTTILADGSVSTIKIIDGAVTTVKIADLNVTTGKIANLGVTTGKIANLGVTNGKLAAGAVTSDKATVAEDSSEVATQQNTSSTSYTTFTTPDTVSLTLGSAQKVMVFFSATADADVESFIGLEVDSVDPTDYTSLTMVVDDDATNQTYSRAVLLSLGSGSHTINLVGKVGSAGTLNVRGRYLLAMALGI